MNEPPYLSHRRPDGGGGYLTLAYPRALTLSLVLSMRSRIIAREVF
jgi:hypothetical protein